jgi:hypothetical protein
MLASSPEIPAAPWVLRVSPGAPDGDWWNAAQRRRDAPPSISALLHGRVRVEVTPVEAAQAIEWASGLEGWSAAASKPLFIHQPDSTQHD